MDPAAGGVPCTDPFVGPVLKALRASLLQVRGGGGDRNGDEGGGEGEAMLGLMAQYNLQAM